MDALTLIGIIVTVIGIVVGFPTLRDYLKEKLHPKERHLTPNFYKRANSNFVDRDFYFKEIRVKLKQNNILLIYGIGGIGKSSITIEYLNKKRWFFDSIKHRYFLEVDSGIEEAFKSLLLDKTKDKDIDLNIILDEIDNKNTILVLDNVLDSQMEELAKILNQLTNAKVIVTSRGENLNISNRLKITVLEEREAIDLFESYFGKVQDDNIKKIIELGNKTPLVLEILAKHTKHYLTTKTSKEILEIFQNSKNNNGAKIFLKGKKASIKELIEGIFNINEIDTDEKKAIMLALANLDPNGVEIKQLLKWLKVEDETEYINAKNELINLGWINEKENILKTHRVIIEVIKENIEDEEVLDTLFNSLANEIFLGVKNPIYLSEFIPHSKKLLKSKFENENYAYLSHQLSTLYRAVENYKEALRYAKKSIFVREKLQVEQNILAISYSNISMVYIELKNCKNALRFINKAIQIQKKLNNQKSLAIAYSNKSTIYYDLNKLDKALEFQKKSIYIKEKIFSNNEDKFEIATSYNNISFIYSKIKNFTEALKYQLNAEKIIEKIDKTHIHLGKLNKNIANTYYDLKNYKKAKEYIDKSISILQQNKYQNLDEYLNLQKKIEAKL